MRSQVQTQTSHQSSDSYSFIKMSNKHFFNIPNSVGFDMIYYLHIKEEITHFKTLPLAKARMLASIFPVKLYHR